MSAARTPPRTAPPLGKVLAGAVVMYAAVALVAAGGAMGWADRTQRAEGLFVTSARHYDIDAAALRSDHIDLPAIHPGWLGPDSMLGRVRVELAAGDGTPMFLGVAPTEDVQNYLDGVAVAAVADLGGVATPVLQPGPRSPAIPGDAGIWAAATSGPAPLTLSWDSGGGDWSVVLMRADGSTGFDATVRAGAEVPALPWIAAGTFGAGVTGIVAGMTLFVVPLRNREDPAGSDSAGSRTGPAISPW